LIANAIIDIKTAYGWVRPLVRPEEWEKVERLFYHKYVYGTTAIEGVMLTEQETAKVLETELTPQNKPVLDVYAVNNYKHLKLFLKGYRGPINEKVIKQIHDILMYGMRNERGEPVARGVYREMPVIIQGLGYRPPPAEQVPQQMRYLVAEYEAKSREGIHQVELASIFHQKFEEIHPFQDGNGRVGREILNIMLERAGFPPIYVTPESRSDYIGALEKGNSGDFLPLIQFVTNRMGATINFIYSKTGVYEIISAKKVRELSKNDELYNAVISTLQESREGDDLP
jgi:Fic family protein